MLPVVHYVEGLETLTRKIGSAAKTAIEESGTNMLYLILGFLEWYESDDSQQPLLTVPISLDRSGGKEKGFECTSSMRVTTSQLISRSSRRCAAISDWKSRSSGTRICRKIISLALILFSNKSHAGAYADRLLSRC